MPLTTTATCPQCRGSEPERFALERHTVWVCPSCGYSWTAPPERTFRGTCDPDHLAQARERLRGALLRFLRPWVYPNSGAEPLRRTTV
jgi:transposase-like protein